MKDIVFKVFLGWFLMIFLGCGGSSTQPVGNLSPDGDKSLPLQKGYVIDSPISGLGYECGDIVGTTDEKGMFKCRVFPVTYKIGNLIIAKVSKMPSDHKVYPQDIIGKSRTNFTDTKVVALTRLLQSLDDDGDIDKVIKITPQVIDTFSKKQEFSRLGESEVKKLVEDAGKIYVSKTDAMTHLKDNIEKLTSIMITPTNTTIELAKSAVFKADGTFSNGVKRDITNDVTWSSSKPAIATINGSTAKAKSVGTTTITAVYKGKSKTATLTVTEASLISLEVNATNTALAEGTQTQLSATGTFGDDTTTNMTSQVTWSSSDTTKATVDATGVVTALKSDTVIMTATKGTITATKTIMITDATLTGIEITPDTLDIAKGLTKQLSVAGTYTNNQTQTLTSGVDFNSSDETIATVDATGVVTAIKEGTVTIGAKSGEFTVEATIHVTPAVLSSIKINPLDVAKGKTVQLSVIGTYSDGTTEDVSSQVTWISVTPDLATVSPSGEVMTKALGIAKIKATAGEKSDEMTITVSDAALESMVIVTDKNSIVKGLTTQLKVNGTYSDGAVSDITSQVTWSVDNSFVTVNDVGLVTAKNVGKSVLTASLSGKTAQVEISVLAVKLSSIAIAETADIKKGETVQLSAIGTYTDKTTKDITTNVAWKSSDTTKATIDANGLLKTLVKGTVSVEAIRDGISASTMIKILPPTFVDTHIKVPTYEVMVGKTSQLSAIATFSDGSEKNITNEATWTINGDNTVASVSSSGLLRGDNIGETMVVATYNGHSEGAVMTVIKALNTIHVSTTQELRQALLDAAQNGMDDEIILADGVYKTTDDGKGTFLYFSDEPYNLTLKGSTYENVVLSGDHQNQIFNHNKIDNIENTIVFFNLSFVDGNSTNDGGAISSNNGDIIIHKCKFLNNSTSRNYGGAIMIYPGKLEIYNSIFLKNSAKGGGGALRVFDDAIIQNSKFSENNTRQYIGSHCGGGAISSLDGGTLFISDSNFTNNTSECGGGGAIYGKIEAYNLQVIDNNASGSGGGIYGGGTLSKSLIKGNRCIGACYGGGISFDGTISNSIIINNQSEVKDNYEDRNSGGLYSLKGFVINNIIANNSSGVGSQRSYFINNIFFNNNDFDINVAGNEVAKVKNNYIDETKIQGISVKENNIFNGTNLGFTDVSNGDYRLTSNSDLIDAGITEIEGVTFPEKDLNGNPRISGPSIDIGPYEFQE